MDSKSNDVGRNNPVCVVASGSEWASWTWVLDWDKKRNRRMNIIFIINKLLAVIFVMYAYSIVSWFCSTSWWLPRLFEDLGWVCLENFVN